MTDVLTALSARVRDHNLTLVAAGVAFYAFLAFVPALIAVVSVYGLVADPNEIQRQVGNFAGALPDEVQQFIEFQLRSIASASRTGVSVTLVVSIAFALWAASGGMAALVTGIHVAHEQHQPKSFVRKRAKALLLTVAALLLLGIVVFIVALVPPLVDDLGSGATTALAVARWPVLAVVMIIGLGALYRLSLADPPDGWLGFVSAGTVVAAISWIAVSVLFSIYTANFARYSKTYGSLATIVVLLLWLYLSALSVLIGAEVDAARGPKRLFRRS